MRMNVLLIIGLLLFNMVAVHSGPPDASGSASTSSGEAGEWISISKGLVSVTKLNGTNYDVWYAGLLTLLMVGSAYRRALARALDEFKQHMDQSLDLIVHEP